MDLLDTADDEPVLLALEPEPEEPRPGLDEASTDEPVWLGVTESPTPHEAEFGGVDQAAFEVATAGEPFAPREPLAVLTPVPSPVPPPEAPAPSAPDPAETPPAEALADLAGAAAALLEELLGAALLPPPGPATQEIAPPAAPSPPPAPAVAAPGEQAPAHAIIADRQSDATAAHEPLEVRPGRPLAGRGLDIRTVRPTWPITVTLMAVPRNPTVEITFGRTGKVIRAAFVEGQDTGYADVDGPLLDAVYRWTAKGKALADLPPDDPEAGVTLRIRILLRGA